MRRVLVMSADKGWVIRESSAPRIEAQQAGELGREGESIDHVELGMDKGREGESLDASGLQYITSPITDYISSAAYGRTPIAALHAHVL